MELGNLPVLQILTLDTKDSYTQDWGPLVSTVFEELR